MLYEIRWPVDEYYQPDTNGKFYNSGLYEEAKVLATIARLQLFGIKREQIKVTEYAEKV